ncbi:UxaA family hydrolase [Vibrio sp. CDRSL-10 TSBA]
MKNRFIKIHPQDNVIVCLDHFSSGEVIQVDNQNITFQQDTPQGSKIAVETIPVGANVLKYGSAIGHAISNIETGDWVHTHNLKTNLNDTQSYQYSPIHPSEKLTSLPSRNVRRLSAC